MKGASVRKRGAYTMGKLKEELKPCPFCGKEIHILYVGGGWFWEHKIEELQPSCPITHSKKNIIQEMG